MSVGTIITAIGVSAFVALGARWITLLPYLPPEKHHDAKLFILGTFAVALLVLLIGAWGMKRFPL